MAYSRPNILLIVTDQHRLSAMGCYGETPCKTPNLDQLAKEGIRFETAYTSCPVCSPARATMMTGLYNHQHGMCSNSYNLGSSVHELPDTPDSLPRQLIRQGYRCGYTGKWHLGSGSDTAFKGRCEPSLPRDHGFDGQNFPGHGGGGFAYPEYQAYLKEHGYTHEVTELPGVSYKTCCDGITSGILKGPVESTVPAFLTSHTIDLIDSYRDGDDPFFIWHNFWGPHGPYYIPEKYFNMYKDVEIPEWPNYRWEGCEENTPCQVKLHPKRDELEWNDWADTIRHYYAFTTMIDEQIGRMIDHLRANGLLENTVIMFTADHGETVGSHGGLTDKGWHHFEEIQRIPFIVRQPDSWDDARRGTVRDEWVSLIDLYPTLIDIAGGADGSPDTPGLSLAPLLHGQSIPWRDSVVVEFHGVNGLATSMASIRQGNLKYGWNNSSWDELYDLDADPHEMTNLVNHLDRAGDLRKMRELMAAWMDEHNFSGRGMYRHSRMNGKGF